MPADTDSGPPTEAAAQVQLSLTNGFRNLHGQACQEPSAYAQVVIHSTAEIVTSPMPQTDLSGIVTFSVKASKKLHRIPVWVTVDERFTTNQLVLLQP